MEKPTMLLISRSSTTNVGMRSYLNHIFSKYIHLETCLAADVDTERMEKADLVLFSSRFAAEDGRASHDAEDPVSDLYPDLQPYIFKQDPFDPVQFGGVSGQ